MYKFELEDKVKPVMVFGVDGSRQKVYDAAVQDGWKGVVIARFGLVNPALYTVSFFDGTTILSFYEDELEMDKEEDVQV